MNEAQPNERMASRFLLTYDDGVGGLGIFIKGNRQRPRDTAIETTVWRIMTIITFADMRLSRMPHTKAFRGFVTASRTCKTYVHHSSFQKRA
jgi:hypothetical protein